MSTFFFQNFENLFLKAFLRRALLHIFHKKAKYMADKKKYLTAGGGRYILCKGKTLDRRGEPWRTAG